MFGSSDADGAGDEFRHLEGVGVVDAAALLEGDSGGFGEGIADGVLRGFGEVMDAIRQLRCGRADHGGGFIFEVRDI